MKKQLLICGDSFSYDFGNDSSWLTGLTDYHVTNLSQAGCGEYKIYLQLKSAELSKFDQLILCHTSPNRLYIAQNSGLHQALSHKNSDLLFADVDSKKHQSMLARVAYEYFTNIFDVDYYNYIHNLICADIDHMTSNHRVLHVTSFDYSDLYQFNGKLLNLHNIWQTHPGSINHYSELGNQIVLKRIMENL